MGMLNDLQNKNVFSPHLKVWVLLVWWTLSGRVFQAFEAPQLKAFSSQKPMSRLKARSSQNPCLDHGKNRSRFDDADPRTEVNWLY